MWIKLEQVLINLKNIDGVELEENHLTFYRNNGDKFLCEFVDEKTAEDILVHIGNFLQV